MKKALSIVLTVCMLVSISTIAAAATNDTLLTTTSATVAPDWVITEISQDQTGDGTGGYSSTADPFEFIEIYNNSGSTLNLYDYCMTYNGNARTNENFETVIVEITPFMAGDYFDGSTVDPAWTDTSKGLPCDYSNKPVNPDTCMVEAGEVVVLWVIYRDAYFNTWNDGKGLSLDNFRTFWQVPENVKVIAVDGNSSTSTGGYDKNFNVKNSDTGTYGIALYSDALNASANVKDSTYPVVYTESTELVAWATMDFKTQLLAGSQPNMTFNFTVDSQGLGAAEWIYTQDARRMLLLEMYMSPTLGTLTQLQKLTLGVAFAAGETCDFVDGDIYIPSSDLGAFLGFEINGTLYPLGSTFTAPSAGVYSVEYKYGEAETTAQTTTDAPVTTEAPADDTTVKDTTVDGTTVDGTTAADIAGTDTTAADTTTTPTEKSGCGSVIGFSVLATLIPAAVVICKKKH